MKTILIAIIFASMLGCVNPYQKFYRSQSTGETVFDIPSGNVQLKYGSSYEKDYWDMIEDGYVQMGYSSFIMGNMPEYRDAIIHAKTINADVVIVYNPTKAGSSTFVMTSTTMNAFGGFNSISAPIEINYNENVATYWRKIVKNWKFGVVTKELDSSDRKLIASNFGVKVVAVYKGSPAFAADITRGDVIKSINGITVNTPAEVGKAISAAENKTLEVSLIKQSGSKTVRVQL